MQSSSSSSSIIIKNSITNTRAGTNLQQALLDQIAPSSSIACVLVLQSTTQQMTSLKYKNLNVAIPIIKHTKRTTTNNKQQTTNNKQQTTNNKQQTTNNKKDNNKQQTTNNKQQTTNNKQVLPNLFTASAFLSISVSGTTASKTLSDAVFSFAKSCLISSSDSVLMSCSCSSGVDAAVELSVCSFDCSVGAEIVVVVIVVDVVAAEDVISSLCWRVVSESIKKENRGTTPPPKKKG